MILTAGLLAFAVSAAAGRMLVPFLEKKKAAQPLKDEVAKKVYGEQDGGAEGTD